jgi:large subunit ribosomal protein L13
MKTSTIAVTAPAWYVIDAEGHSLGKIAVKAATYLKGKHKPTYAPHQLCGDQIIVINASKIELPPKKIFRKEYFRHTGFAGGKKIVGLEDMLAKKPEYVVEHAVKGMLPDNRLAREMMKRLHVFADAKHDHEAQKPSSLAL